MCITYFKVNNNNNRYKEALITISNTRRKTKQDTNSNFVKQTRWIAFEKKNKKIKNKKKNKQQNKNTKKQKQKQKCK